MHANVLDQLVHLRDTQKVLRLTYPHITFLNAQFAMIFEQLSDAGLSVSDWSSS